MVGEFPGSGLYYFAINAGSWTQLLDADASLVAMDAIGTIVAAYPSGVYANPPSSSTWLQLAATVPFSLSAAGAGLVVAGYSSGIFLYQNGGWATISTNTPLGATVNNLGQVAATFGSGVYWYANGNWQQLSPYAANSVAVSADDSDLIASFAGSGIYDYTIQSGSWVNDSPYSVQ